MEPAIIVDTSVWEALFEGKKEAFALFYRTYFCKFYNYGFKFTSNTIMLEDCIQETLIAFWMNREKYRVLEKPGSYLEICFRNRLIKAIKTQPNYCFLPEGCDFNVDIFIEQIMVDKEQMYEHHVHLNKALLQLTPREREAIYLKFFENLSYNHIAELLRISTKSSSKLVAKAVVALRAVYLEKIVNQL